MNIPMIREITLWFVGRSRSNSWSLSTCIKQKHSKKNQFLHCKYGGQIPSYDLPTSKRSPKYTKIHSKCSQNITLKRGATFSNLTLKRGTTFSTATSVAESQTISIQFPIICVSVLIQLNPCKWCFCSKLAPRLSVILLKSQNWHPG